MPAGEAPAPIRPALPEGDAPPDEPDEPEEPTVVTLRIESEPPGATVRTGAFTLGVTPLSISRGPEPGPLPLVLTLDGHETARAELRADRDGQVMVTLSKKRRLAPEPALVEPPPPEKPKRVKKVKKRRKKKIERGTLLDPFAD
jgi:hypothetical protein